MIENAAVRLEATERGALRLTDRRTGARFEEIVGELYLSEVRSAGDTMLARLMGAAFDMNVRLTLTEDGFTLALHADADALMPEELAYPGAWQTRAGDLLAFGHSEGVCFDAEEEFPLPERWGMTAGGGHVGDPARRLLADLRGGGGCGRGAGEPARGRPAGERRALAEREGTLGL